MAKKGRAKRDRAMHSPGWKLRDREVGDMKPKKTAGARAPWGSSRVWEEGGAGSLFWSVRNRVNRSQFLLTGQSVPWGRSLTGETLGKWGKVGTDSQQDRASPCHVLPFQNPSNACWLSLPAWQTQIWFAGFRLRQAEKSVEEWVWSWEGSWQLH